jgi:rubredoxin
LLHFSTTRKEFFVKRYLCIACGYYYDPAVGDPDAGIAPGTAFENLPEDWVCPQCGVGKEEFTVEE